MNEGGGGGLNLHKFATVSSIAVTLHAWETQLILIIEKNVFRPLMCLNYLTIDSRPFIVKTHD